MQLWVRSHTFVRAQFSAASFSAVVLLACCTTVLARSSTDAPDNFQNNTQAREIVKQVVANELKQEEADKGHYMFKLKTINPKGTKVQEIVQTDQGSIARTLEVDGHAPSQDQLEAEKQKIQHLMNDPSEQKRRQKRDREDENRAQIMVRALPNAFFYQEIGRDGDTLKLRFRPDPNYVPQSHEESVYTGMAGELWLNTAQQRLQKIDAHLFHDVDFGWGILGRLYKGGSFLVQQDQVDGNHWDSTVLKLDLTGKVMMIKSVVYKEQEYESDFHHLPDHLTMAQGLEMLNKDIPQVAQKSGQ
jgi:hypothetical protein